LPLIELPQRKGLDLCARQHPGRRTGDFFDGLAIGSRVLFLLTDISGAQVEGDGAAAGVQNAFRKKAQDLFAASEVNESDAIAALAHAVNLALIEAAQGLRFAPTFLACFNLTLGILTYCNAGTLLALSREGRNVCVLESSGMPLGLFSHTTFEAMIRVFQEGDALLVVTKGVTESRRGSSEFGGERVERLLKNSIGQPACGICEAVLREAYDFANQPWSRVLSVLHPGKQCRQDDLTALAFVRTVTDHSRSF
jgi:serine phosphatase RsbU (regulator of sigma subunit)